MLKNYFYTALAAMLIAKSIHKKVLSPQPPPSFCHAASFLFHNDTNSFVAVLKFAGIQFLLLIHQDEDLINRATVSRIITLPVLDLTITSVSDTTRLLRSTTQ